MAGVYPEFYPGGAVYRFAVTAENVVVRIDDGNALKVTELFFGRDKVQFAPFDPSTLNSASMQIYRTPRELSVTFLMNAPAPAPAPTGSSTGSC